MQEREPLRVGLVGIGVGARQLLPALTRGPHVKLTAVADVRPAALGKLGMLHSWHYTDWMYRPRLPAELDVAQGGGPVFRQASHQVDIVRSIAGRRIRGIRAMVVQLDLERGAPGAYSALLEFEDRTPATIVSSGYGGFDMGELLGRSGPRVGRVASTPQDEAAAKDALRFGDDASPAGAVSAAATNSLGLFGLTLVTCEGGDLRESPDGLYLYRRGERQRLPVRDELRGAAELEELYHAVRHGRPLAHDGRWGEATLAVCLAIHESARTRSEVLLSP